jgi:uncharacterized protein with HEPN domain
MPLEEHDLKLLWDMLRSAQTLRGFTAGLSRETFDQQEVVRLAAERCIEIIGEAARGVTPPGRAALPEIEWGAIVATRHILAHQYDEVDHDRIWRIVTVHAPALIAALKPVLDANPPGPESRQPPDQP